MKYIRPIHVNVRFVSRTNATAELSTADKDSRFNANEANGWKNEIVYI